jgi:hypothetical protein
VIAGEIGQIRGMLSAVGDRSAAREFHRTVSEAVDAADTAEDAPWAEQSIDRSRS